MRNALRRANQWMGAAAMVVAVSLPAAAQGGRTGGGSGGTRSTTVSGIVVSAGSVGPVVSWQPVTEAVSYKVERFLSGSPTVYANQSGAITTTSWTDVVLPAAGTYTYRVTATLSKGTATGEVNYAWSPPATLQTLGLSVASTQGGNIVSGQVTLSGAAPVGGTAVSLTSNKPAIAAVPPSTTVPQGATSAMFNVTTASVATNTSVVISAMSGSDSRSVTLGILAPPAPVFAVTPASATFGSVSIATGTSAPPNPVTFVVMNAGTASMSNLTVALQGPAVSAFLIVGTTCPSSLAAGASCRVDVGFRPTTAGSFSATLTLSSINPSLAYTVSLFGTATAWEDPG